MYGTKYLTTQVQKNVFVFLPPNDLNQNTLLLIFKKCLIPTDFFGKKRLIGQKSTTLKYLIIKRLVKKDSAQKKGLYHTKSSSTQNNFFFVSWQAQKKIFLCFSECLLFKNITTQKKEPTTKKNTKFKKKNIFFCGETYFF